MATSYKTPGVYVEEIPKLPPSVAQVETAIPAFIGYTEKAEKLGENIQGKPTRITSLVEFESMFGGAYAFVPGDIKVLLDEANNFAVKSVGYAAKVFYLYDSMRLFFENGGGDCYVVSVGSYAGATFDAGGQLASVAALRAGLDEVEKYDEPTILVVPDAVSLKPDEFYPLQQAALAQCAKLGDRVAVFDLQENKEATWDGAYKKFRDKIGISNLKYGAAYTPWVYSSFAGQVPYSLIRNTGTVHAVRNAADSADLDLAMLTSNPALNALVASVNVATDDQAIVKADAAALQAGFKSLSDRYAKLKGDVLTAVAGGATTTAFDALADFVRSVADAFPAWRSSGSAKKFLNPDLANTLDTAAKDSTNGLRKFVKDLIAWEKNTGVDALLSGAIHDYTAYQSLPAAGADSWLGVADLTQGDPANIPALATDFGATGTDAEKRAATLAAIGALDPIFSGLAAFFSSVASAAGTYQTLAQDALYNNHPVVSNIVKSIKKQLSKLPPTAAVAGIYARVDNARGVWKAPANESLNSVIGPVAQITAEQQGNLNVDAVAGKSINVIRAFTGKGTLVWGARTLAGNDNEWRYVNVRRFFNMVEESSKKSTEPFVFETNDANTWVKVQGMLENFLTVLWRQGALQGAKPEHAFYVAVGLGKTMTSLDILEGRMIVEIGMAVVRPAEFIILRFSHKLAES